jgi:hypothetical protein
MRADSRRDMRSLSLKSTTSVKAWVSIAGAWTKEAEFNKDGTLYVGLNPTEGGWYVDGDLKKVEE